MEQTHDLDPAAPFDQLTTARRHDEVLSMTLVVPMAQDELWECLVDPARLVRWSSVVPDHRLDQVGSATSSEQPGDAAVDATVIEARAPWYLEHQWGPDVLGWQLAPAGNGTQLNLVHQLTDPARMAEMAAGWHICLTVLQRQAAGADLARIVGKDALAVGWEDLRYRYRELLPERRIED